MMLSLTSVTPPGEISGPEIEVDTTMSVVKENEDEVSGCSPTNRPVKKMRFDQALDNLTEEEVVKTSVSDHNANLAPCEDDRQDLDQDNASGNPIFDKSESPGALWYTQNE